MKKIAIITMSWLFAIVMAHAEIPKAGLTIAPLNSEQWPAEFRLTLTVPNDHHAYLDAGQENIYIPIALDSKEALTAARLKISTLQKPAGVFDGKVKATVLRGQGEFTFSLTPLDRQPPDRLVTLAVSYQLCNDLTHVCFRPQTARINVTLPVAAAMQSAASADESISFTDQLLSLFKNNQDNTFVMFWLMFMAGILSVATPCVYPMLPITSMFIINRANGIAEKEKLHALVYVIGIIGTYMILGLMAGMTGGAFNTIMQSAWVNIGFALFFAFFAVALLGFTNWPLCRMKCIPWINNPRVLKV